MSEIILRDAIVSDDWQVVRPVEGQPTNLPAGKIIVPLAIWLEQKDTLLARGEVGVWLGGADEPAALGSSLTSLNLVAVDFPKFTDGRGFSIAYLLRSRFGYRGELRAIGDVLPDQLFFMKRVGFDAFAVRPDKDIHQALRSLRPFSDSYQGSWNEAVPAYRRHNRAWPTVEKG
jgi:uncharacterized protein (DUF934 family)